MKRRISASTQMDLEIALRPCNKSDVTVQLPKVDFFIRKGTPKPSPVFLTYWKFAKARQDVFFERILSPVSFSKSFDLIISRYRFTNVYRASDRVSQYLIQHVIYDRKRPLEDIVFRLLLFKFFNKIETWEALERKLGDISWKGFNFERYDKILSQMISQKKSIYSAAYIMSSGREAFDNKRKHKNHLKVIELMMNQSIHEQLLKQPNLESVFQLLCQFPCIGKFLGYQLAIDFNYSEILDFSENDFVEPGPGALDGISKCFTDLGDHSPTDIIHYMVDIQEEAFKEHAPGFQDLWGRKLHLIDCQNIFCEISKYARVAYPDIRGVSNRTRIKQKFFPSSRPLDTPWYPPQWEINDSINRDLGKSLQDRRALERGLRQIH